MRSDLINRYTLKRRALPLLLMLQHLEARDIEVKVKEHLAIADKVATRRALTLAGLPA